MCISHRFVDRESNIITSQFQSLWYAYMDKMNNEPQPTSIPSTYSVTGIAGAYSESKLTGNLRDQKPNTVHHNPQSNPVKIEKNNWKTGIKQSPVPIYLPKPLPVSIITVCHVTGSLISTLASNKGFRVHCTANLFKTRQLPAWHPNELLHLHFKQQKLLQQLLFIH